MTSSHAQRRAFGDYGERLAARRLEETGYEIVDRNWRCRDGEIDIVARAGAVLVVCEVKTRSSVAFGTPVEAVDERRAGRLHRLGRRWLAAHPEARPVDRIRVDVVAVLRPRQGVAEVEHLIGVV